MVGGALVGFRMDTIDLLCGETSLNRRNSNRFLAYQIPGCQVTSVFGTSMRYPVLTTSWLAYQMPYHADWRPHEDTAASAALRLRPSGTSIEPATGNHGPDAWRALPTN